MHGPSYQSASKQRLKAQGPDRSNSHFMHLGDGMLMASMDTVQVSMARLETKLTPH